MARSYDSILQGILKDKDEKELVLELMMFMSIHAECRQAEHGVFNMVRVIGVDATLRMIAAMGGKSYRIPSHKDLTAAANLVGCTIHILRGNSEQDTLKLYKGTRVNMVLVRRMVNAILAYRKGMENMNKRVDAAEDEIDRMEKESISP